MTDARPWQSEEAEMARAAIRQFLEARVVPHHAAWEAAGLTDRAIWRQAGALGFLCPSIPAVYGGGGGDRSIDVVFLEEASRAGVGGGLGAMMSLHGSIVAHYVLTYGTEDQKRRWLPAMADGTAIAAIAMTEPGAGSDLRGIRTTARRDGDHYVLNGQKTFISNGQNGDLILVVARHADGSAADRLSIFLVEADRPGFVRGRNLDKIGQPAADTSELFFDDVRIPASNLLGIVEGEGFRQLTVELAWERLSCAISAIGDAERAVDLTIAYTKERRAFGQSLFDFQNTQFKLAEAKTGVTVGRVFVDNLTQRLLNHALDPTTAAMAKLWCTEQQGRVVDECVQLFGGYGYMTEYPIARLYVDARITRIFGGSNEIMKLIIARSL
jgi:acyl-CoA dehydrogenase